MCVCVCVCVLKLLIMLEIGLITVIYKRIGKFLNITQSELNTYKWRYFQLKSSRGCLCICTLILANIRQSHTL